MKKIILFFTLLLTCNLYVLGNSAADTAFEKGEFTEALSAYQEEAKTATGAALYTAQLRIIASKYMLGQYMEAAKSAYTFPLPTAPLWKARFLLYRIKTAQEVKNMYRPALPDSDEEQGDFENLSNKQWQDKINECFKKLWSLRNDLIQAPISKEILILNVKDTDTLAIPTLFDFVVQEWKKELINTPPASPLLVRPLLNTSYRPQMPSTNDIHKWAAVLAEAVALEGKNRANARLIWQANLLLLPLEHPAYFTFENKKQERAQIMETLEVLSGYKKQEAASWWKRLQQLWPSTEKPLYGQSYAAFKAASLLEEDKKYEQAVALCNWSKTLGNNYYTQSCERIAQQIREPRLSVETSPFTQDPAHTSISFTARNVSKVYLRLYEVSEQDLLAWNNRSKTTYNWDYLTHINSDKIPQLLTRQPLHQLTQAVQYKYPYAYSKNTTQLPGLKKPGFYVVALSYNEMFDTTKAPVSTIVLNATDLALFAASGMEDDPQFYQTRHAVSRNPVIFNIYTLNFKTGQPEPNTDVTYITDWNGNRSQGQTNSQGILSLARPISLNGKSNSYRVLPKAVKNNSTTFLTNSVDLYFNVPEPVQFYTETDRAVYRPGQKVQIALYGLERTGRGLKPLAKTTPVTLLVRDANHETLLQQNLSLNDYGTARTELVLPQTGLLGHYSIEVSSSQNNARGYGSFQVEEYKLPEYEVSLDKNAVIQYGRKATVTGKASYYFGAPLEKATVKYTVKRRYYIPRFCWWWIIPSAEEALVAQGETKTNKDGSFTVSFTPQPGLEKEYPTNFHVEAHVFDESGRSVDASQDYKASDKTLFFAPSFTQGFYDAQTPTRLAQIQLTDVNAEPTGGKFTAEIYELENIYQEKNPATDSDEEETVPYRANPLSKEHPLETWYGKNKEIRKVSLQTFSAQKGQEINLDIPALPEGIYKLKLQAKEANPVELIFLVANATSKLDLPALAIPQHETYYPGSEAKILLGAHKLKGPKYLAIYQQNLFLTHRKVLPAGTGIYTFPVQDKHRGGLFIRWIGASNYQFFEAHTALQVPFDNKELTLHTNIPPAVKPAEKVQWNVTAKDATGNNVNGQLSVRVYDQALDYYASISPVFSLENLYPQQLSGPDLTNSAINRWAISYDNIRKPSKDYLPAPSFPRLNLERFFAAYGGLRGGSKMMLSAKAMPQMVTMNTAAMADMEGAAAEESAMARGTDEMSAPTSSQIIPRTDFSETAYFNPMVPLQNGKASLSFTMPQSLTSWNIMGFAITPNIDLGSFTAQTVTRKDLMVRLSLPRFWREGDRTTLVVQVTNTSAKKRTAEVTLDALLDGKEAAKHFGLTDLTRTVTVPANGNVAVTWPVSVASGVGVARLTATLRSLKDTDAESREIPVLPSKERIAESVTKALDKGTQSLQLDNLLTPDPTREVSTVNLRVDPSLLLSVLNAMPQLLRPSYQDALSLVNRYVPLAVINAFYEQYPDLKQAVKKLPKRNTQTPAWDSTDPSRLLLLTETPWLQRSYGGATREQFLTDLFNPSAVAGTRTQVEKLLTKYQTASGGFTWMPGGNPSEFITMEILSSYAQILRYGGKVPEVSAKRALAWLAPKIEQNLTEGDASAYTVSNALYAAYIFTAFPQTWKEVKNAPVKKWLDYADSHKVYMTPLGKTMAAAAHFRLGNKEKANAYLDTVLSLMKTDPVTGAYFAPEAQSWLWYNDTLSTQTMTLRTLMEIRPQSDKAAELVKWLLFNRKAQCWRDTTSTAKAIYALLDYMQKRGLFNQAADYKVQWGAMQKQLHFEPFDWSDKLTWTQEAINVPATYYKAQVQKTGGMTGFVTLDAVYTTANAKASPKGILNIERRYMLKYQEGGRNKVRALQPGEAIPVGSEVEVQLKLTASSAFDFVLLSDPKPSGFENTELLSGWTWDALSMYREIRDASTHFFINRVPAGTYTLRYTLRPTLDGEYRVLPAQVQSMYAPEFSAHTASDGLKVRKEN